MAGIVKKKKVPRLQDLYPGTDIVCKIRVNGWQGTCVCEDVATDTHIYTALIVSEDPREAIELMLDAMEEHRLDWRGKTVKRAFF